MESSPLQRYRNYGILSVTDLVSPTWCEVQFDYGLRGKRSRPVKDRPATFRSALGKEIKINKGVAVKNEVTTTKGKEVHKSLEREVKGPEVMVDITMPEERWALRLVNMITCLRGMKEQGLTREMPVFGVEDDEIIVGIIDEIHYQPVENFTKSMVTSSQTLLEMSSPSQTHNGDTNYYKLQLIDTKTRRTFSIPPPEDMLSSRLQLMMYHRLLSRLVSVNHPFDFARFWQISGVGPECRLSTKFIIQAGLLADDSEFQVLSLGDLSIYWNDLVHQLNIVGVSDELQLIYRLQPNTNAVIPAGVYSEKEALSMAIEASLAESRAGNSATATSSTSERDLNKGLENKPSPAIKTKTSKDQFTLVGTKTFNYDPDLLSAHLTDVLGYWRGLRSPKGVPVQLARRCQTCEYLDDCEWREERARDFREQALLKREGSGSGTPISM